MFSCPGPHRKCELNSCIGQSLPPTRPIAAAALRQYSLKCTKCVFSGAGGRGGFYATHAGDSNLCTMSVSVEKKTL